jgi:hypothetical protein
MLEMAASALLSSLTGAFGSMDDMVPPQAIVELQRQACTRESALITVGRRRVNVSIDFARHSGHQMSQVWGGRHCGCAQLVRSRDIDYPGDGQDGGPVQIAVLDTLNKGAPATGSEPPADGLNDPRLSTSAAISRSFRCDV